MAHVTRIGAVMLELDGAQLFATTDGPAIKMDCDARESTELWFIAQPRLKLCPACGWPLHARGQRP